MKTKVTNTSGAEKFFGFLPPHGVTIDDNDYVIIDGDLRSILGGGGNRYNRNRELDALDDACVNGDICLEAVNESCCSSSSSP